MFSSFLKLNKTVTVGLEIGATQIKLNQVENKGEKRVLTKIAVLDTPPGTMEKGKITDPETLGESIRTVMKINGFNSRNVVMGLSGRNVIIRQVKFPLMEPAELRETLKWEADRYLPLPPNDSIVDFHILQHFVESSPPEMEVVLVGVNKEVINKCLKIAEIAEIELKAIEVTPFAFLKSLDSDRIPGTIVALNAGSIDLEMLILHNGLLRFSRVIPNASIEDLLREIQRSIDFHRIQNRDEVVERIILAGNHPEMDDLFQALRQELGITVEKAIPYSLVEPVPTFDPAYLEKMAPLLGVSIGLALREEK